MAIDISQMFGVVREVCEGTSTLPVASQQACLRKWHEAGLISDELYAARMQTEDDPSPTGAGVMPYPCQHRGEERDRLGCCGVVYRCEIHKLCTIGRNEWNWQSCKDCGDRLP